MPEQAEKLKRLTIDLTGDEHRVLKAHAAEAGVSMRDLVLEVLRREGLLTRTKQGARR
jgi:Antitoxin ParD